MRDDLPPAVPGAAALLTAAAGDPGAAAVGLNAERAPGAARASASLWRVASCALRSWASSVVRRATSCATSAPQQQPQPAQQLDGRGGCTGGDQGRGLMHVSHSLAKSNPSLTQTTVQTSISLHSLQPPPASVLSLSSAPHPVGLVRGYPPPARNQVIKRCQYDSPAVFARVAIRGAVQVRRAAEAIHGPGIPAAQRSASSQWAIPLASAPLAQHHTQPLSMTLVLPVMQSSSSGGAARVTR